MSEPRKFSQETIVASGESVELTMDGHDILFPKLPYDMKQRVEGATNDVQLQQFINSATRMRDQLRIHNCKDAFGDNYDKMRALAGSIKQHTLDHLDYYIEQFIDNATAAGTHVHYAVDAQEANDICKEICRQHNAKLVVKSKSMVTEETNLVHELAEIGVETIETDLGEYILQLDNDAPSHLVTPMIHKNRASVGRAFARELGVQYTDDPQELTQIARRVLRDKYRQADVGMSGGNFMIADSGSVVICTNEGNGRLCTSVPPVHIAYIGIEKMIPSRKHLPVFLKLLSRSAIGSPITVYNHIMTGPKRNAEPDGPQEQHIILIDNGRTEVLKPETREMLRCIRCGACLNSCPVYRKVGGHSYGSVYPGPIGALLTPVFKGLANYKDLPYASSLCGACYEACPVKINIPKYLIQLRSELIGGKHDKFTDRVFFKMWAISLKKAWMYRLAGKMAGVFLRLRHKGVKNKSPYLNRGWVKKAPGPAAGWTEKRDLVTPPTKDFRSWWDTHQKQKGDK